MTRTFRKSASTTGQRNCVTCGINGKGPDRTVRFAKARMRTAAADIIRHLSDEVQPLLPPSEAAYSAEDNEHAEDE